MISNPFQRRHLLEFLKEYGAQALPMDVLMNRYFREHKGLGSKDRAYIAENAYGLVRWIGLIDYLCGNERSWEARLACFENCDPWSYWDKEAIPLPIRSGFSEELFAILAEDMGIDGARAFCRVCNSSAPVTIRTNTLKISRSELMEKLQAACPIEPCERSPTGIRILKRGNFFLLPEFKEGYFEVQDEGSQLLAAMVDVKPGDLVLDYCAGSGGKTLAFAPAMNNKGQVFLHDTRPKALAEARKRLARAGVQNAQVIDTVKLSKLKHKMDWVLADVPCSGTGTLRRNPDMKWKVDKAAIARLTGLQRTIFEKALSFVKPGGQIVYGTCSVLKEENERQIEHFCRTYSLEVVGTPLRTMPQADGMDGFFGAVLKRIIE